MKQWDYSEAFPPTERKAKPMHVTPDILEGIIKFSNAYDHIEWSELAESAMQLLEAYDAPNGSPTSLQLFLALEDFYEITE